MQGIPGRGGASFPGNQMYPPAYPEGLFGIQGNLGGGGIGYPRNQMYPPAQPRGLVGIQENLGGGGVGYPGNQMYPPAYPRGPFGLHEYPGGGGGYPMGQNCPPAYARGLGGALFGLQGNPGGVGPGYGGNQIHQPAYPRGLLGMQGNPGFGIQGNTDGGGVSYPGNQSFRNLFSNPGRHMGPERNDRGRSRGRAARFDFRAASSLTDGSETVEQVPEVPPPEEPLVLNPLESPPEVLADDDHEFDDREENNLVEIPDAEPGPHLPTAVASKMLGLGLCPIAMLQRQLPLHPF